MAVNAGPKAINSYPVMPERALAERSWGFCAEQRYSNGRDTAKRLVDEKFNSESTFSWLLWSGPFESMIKNTFIILRQD